MMPFNEPLRECCPKCDWKSDVLMTSDVVYVFYGNCPKCGEETVTRKLSFVEKIQFSPFLKKFPKI
ncbi:hypothetical protein HT665_08025 [Ursidibacter maritimus]|uniref:Uncharacterized protein n=1 Tax=Ursidibacter maritimus TaxID=1331689 RepID=A0A949T8H4_9PAST|nr:hypothetical protein [Ursidibacter maritimus]KAE9542061.1 hypothetical protein A1D26_07725 [Ursidibacter maritimus]MBV6523137.1 hypothetical protein [Ursidibacter maritimus]MBV6525421.1 hypothetical protein [Ursidibacter maritimus]MBV6527511.1 hypothetical protein [Ursidibacter maritimus]MBV6530460.1 hypothetical protein [Ursidibacter maritimus]